MEDIKGRTKQIMDKIYSEEDSKVADKVLGKTLTGKDISKDKISKII